MNLEDIIIGNEYKLVDNKIWCEPIDPKEITEQRGNTSGDTLYLNNIIVKVLGYQTRWATQSNNNDSVYTGTNPWIYCLWQDQYIKLTYYVFSPIAVPINNNQVPEVLPAKMKTRFELLCD